VFRSKHDYQSKELRCGRVCDGWRSGHSFSAAIRARRMLWESCRVVCTTGERESSGRLGVAVLDTGSGDSIALWFPAAL
jgi:hypothetical protein